MPRTVAHRCKRRGQGVTCPPAWKLSG